jgi:Uma2 family endonuclease
MPVPLDEEVSFAPDLAVEVISKTDDWSAIVAKANQYLKAGTSLVWVIDPYLKGVFVFHENDPFPQILKPEQELEGENVIPGFKLKVSDLFV